MPTMNGEILNIGAVGIELGMSAALIAMLLTKSKLRKFVVVVLGAVTPILLGYAFISLSYFQDPERNAFAFHAMWLMSFIAFVALLAIGLALSFVPRPEKLWARFTLGLLIAPCVFALAVLADYAV